MARNLPRFRLHQSWGTRFARRGSADIARRCPRKASQAAIAPGPVLVPPRVARKAESGALSLLRKSGWAFFAIFLAARPNRLGKLARHTCFARIDSRGAFEAAVPPWIAKFALRLLLGSNSLAPKTGGAFRAFRFRG